MNGELILWTLALLLPLLWLVRQVHEGLQELFYLVTEHKLIAVYLFQILLLPGVVLHELSHLIFAKLLGVRVRNVSLQPQVRREKIQMGAVVIDRPDYVRGLLIGLAPLLSGSVAIVLIGNRVFDVGQVITAATASDAAGVVAAIQAAFGVSDAWIWFYLIFAISNAMLPSESDRASLWPTLVFIAVFAVGAALVGWGPALSSRLARPVEAALGMLLVAFGITLFVDTVFVLVILLLKGLIQLTTGRRLEKST